jgi:ABC-2 type transport system permease protein
LKTSFAVFWKRNLAFAKLAIVSNIEYRFNFFVDAVLQPTLTTGIEILLWFAVFKGAGTDKIGGFSQAYYFSYVIWAAFFARICTNWMYESRMIGEIDSGTINGLLTKPMSFYEYYLSQLFGYKFITSVFSMMVPFFVMLIFDLPTELSRLPLAFILEFYYLILVFSLSFIVASTAFFLNKSYALTSAKNLALWFFTGELFPLDLMAEPFKSFFIALPFSAGVFVPVGYITGRLNLNDVMQSFVSITIGIIITNAVGLTLWKKGLQKYAGTGA